MGTPNDPEAVLRDAFEDIALVVGGIAGLHGLNDDLVWTLMKRLDRVRVLALRRLKHTQAGSGERPIPGAPSESHPAVEEFLLRNRRGDGEQAEGLK